MSKNFSIRVIYLEIKKLPRPRIPPPKKKKSCKKKGNLIKKREEEHWKETTYNNDTVSEFVQVTNGDFRCAEASSPH